METKATNETFIPGTVYIAPSEDGLEIAPNQLEAISVGRTNTAILASQAIIGTMQDTEMSESQKKAEAISDEAIQAIAKKYTTKFGKAKAFAVVASVKRASRRLLMAERAKKLTVVCEDTGIVSLLEVPAIPGYALTYQHPLSILENCRGIAQRGEDYLKFLDTQTLAGILIILANSYQIIRFDKDATGALKNAILRTAGKDLIIDAILLIENQIHSRNAPNLPHLSLTRDQFSDNISMATRLKGYVTLLAESIAVPDTSIYDENAPPKKIGRPVYIRDVEKAEKKLSYLARQEVSEAKKTLASDAKLAKTLASNLVSLGFAKAGLKAFIAQLMGDNGMGLVAADPAIVDMLIAQKLATYKHEDAEKLVAILRKDRSILRKEITEVDDLFDSPSEQRDDPKPGQELAVEESEEVEQDERSEAIQLETTPTEQDTIQQEEKQEEELKAPAGLSKIEQILWMKKMRSKLPKPEARFTQENIPSAANYTPSNMKKKLGED